MFPFQHSNTWCNNVVIYGQNYTSHHAIKQLLFYFSSPSISEGHSHLISSRLVSWTFVEIFEVLILCYCFFRYINVFGLLVFVFDVQGYFGECWYWNGNLIFRERFTCSFSFSWTGSYSISSTSYQMISLTY